MNSIVIANGAALMLVVASTAHAEPAVWISAEVSGRSFEGQFSDGDRISVTFNIRSESDVAVFGGVFSLAARTDDVSIRSVIVNPAFARQADSQGERLPASLYRLQCSQAADDLDRTLGAAGTYVHLMTVELEVRNDGPFRSALEIAGRVALVGEPRSRTVIFDEETTEYVGGMARNRLVVINTGQPEDRTPWTRDAAELDLVVFEPGGRTPVSTLTAGSEYQLHYTATTPGMCGYALTTIARDADHGIASATAPAAGTWADGIGFMAATGETAEMVGLPAPASEHPHWYYRYDMVADDLPQERWLEAGSGGHLFNFVTESPGALNLHLDMWWIDAERKERIELGTNARFLVTDDTDGR